MIEILNLSKSFKLTKEAKKQLLQSSQDSRQQGNTFNALTDVSFACQSGQVLGLLGPNGAGKTTTLRILASSLQPDTGEIRINGENVLTNPILAKKKIGFLSSKTGLYARLTAKENIEYFAKLHGMSKSEIKAVGESLYQQLGIESYLHRRVDTLSSGMHQKVSIARAVIHQPDVLVLDEPTTGLDIMATETVLNFIAEQKQLGRPVIFSTHHMDEIAALADQVAIIDQGRTCFSGSISEFKNKSPSQDLREAFMSIVNVKKDVA
ncbi:MAG: ABC transporter ATP-binding protein [Thalassotalea sp.]